MRIEEVKSYEELQQFLLYQIRVQTLASRMMKLELPEEWFFKLAKFIRFNLKNDVKEKGVVNELDKDCIKYMVKINRIYTIVTLRT